MILEYHQGDTGIFFGERRILPNNKREALFTSKRASLHIKETPSSNEEERFLLYCFLFTANEAAHRYTSTNLYLCVIWVYIFRVELLFTTLHITFERYKIEPFSRCPLHTEEFRGAAESIAFDGFLHPFLRVIK